MKTYQLIFLSLFYAVLGYSQDQILVGQVLTENGVGISNVFIESGNNTFIGVSDSEGYFHTVKKKIRNDTLVFLAEGYISKIVTSVDSLGNRFEVSLQTNLNYRKTDSRIYITETPKQGNFYGFKTGFGIESFMANYDQFSSLIGNELVQKINGNQYMGTFKLNIHFNKIYLELKFGTSKSQEVYASDTLDIDWIREVYGIQVGYNLIDFNKLSICPSFGLYGNSYDYSLNYRLDRISTNQYLNSASIDKTINYNHHTGVINLNLHYRFFDEYKFNDLIQNIELNAFGGFMFNLQKKTTAGAENQKLSNTMNMSYGNYQAGLQLQLCLGWY